MEKTGLGEIVIRLAQAEGGAGEGGGGVPAQAANTEPQPAGDCVVTAESASLSVPVLANDTDPEGDPLNLLSVTQPASGSASIDDGSITFTSGEPGLQTVRYQVGDGEGASAFADMTVFVNPLSGSLPQSVLEGMSGQEMADLARSCVTGSALEIDSFEGPDVTVASLPPGHRAHIAAQPGQSIDLQGAEFASATYVVVQGGLLVITNDGRIVFASGFVDAAESGDPPTLTVAGAPAVAGNVLIAGLEPIGEPAADGQVGRVPQPEAGPEHGGGAGFSPFDPGALPPGLDPLGPLGPTALGPDEEFLLRDTGELIGAGVDEPEGPPGGEEPPGANAAPTITANAEVTRELGEITVTPDFNSGPGFPDLAEKEPLPLDQVNGVDPENLVLGRGGDATIVFRSEVAEFTNALGVYLISPDGTTIEDPQIVFPDIEFGEAIEPGDAVPLSSLYDAAQLAPGTQFGLFVIANGFALNGDLLGADLAFVPSSVAVPTPQLIDAESGEPVAGDVFHSFDPTPGTPLENPLNDGGAGQAVSGLLPDAAGLTIGFEDKPLNFAGLDDPSFGFFDNDFNDVVVDVELAPVQVAAFAPGDIEVAADAVVTDEDDTALSRAEIEIVDGLQTGDSLSLDDSLLEGTGIDLSVGPGADSLVLEGAAPIGTYQEILRSVVIDPGPTEGVREVQLTVFDDGGESGSATVAVDLTGADAEIGTDGPDELLGAPLVADAIGGRGGDDDLFGDSGNDLLDGGTGNDLLDGGEGDDLLVGGPGFDTLAGGPGADTHVYQSLAERGDTIEGFDATAGDVLDFADLLEPAGAIDAGNIEEFVGFTATDGDVSVSVDVDGGGEAFASIDFLTLTDPTGIAPDDPVASAFTNGSLVA